LVDTVVNTYLPGLMGGPMLGANSINRLMSMIQAQQGKMASQSITMGRRQFENMYTNVMRTAQGGQLTGAQEAALSRQAQSISGTMASIGEGMATAFGPAGRSILQSTGLEHLGVLSMPYLGRDVASASSGIPGMDASKIAASMAANMFGSNGRYNVGYTGGLGILGVGSAYKAAGVAGNLPVGAQAEGAVFRSAAMLQSMLGGGDPGSLLSSFNEASGGAVSQLSGSNLESMVKYMRTASMASMMGPRSAMMDPQAMMGMGQQLAAEAMSMGLPGPTGFNAALNIVPIVSAAMANRARGTERRESTTVNLDPDVGNRISETRSVTHREDG
jgi:hypothetical protein